MRATQFHVQPVRVRVGLDDIESRDSGISDLEQAGINSRLESLTCYPKETKAKFRTKLETIKIHSLEPSESSPTTSATQILSKGTSRCQANSNKLSMLSYCSSSPQVWFYSVNQLNAQSVTSSIMAGPHMELSSLFG